MKKKLTQELIFALAVKLALLYALWAVCFSHPIDKTLTHSRVAEHFLGEHHDH